MLPVVLSEEQVEAVFKLASQDEPVNVEVDLQAQQVQVAGEVFAFEIDPSIKQRLLSGQDFIGVSEAYMEQIVAFEQSEGRDQGWR